MLNKNVIWCYWVGVIVSAPQEAFQKLGALRFAPYTHLLWNQPQWDLIWKILFKIDAQFFTKIFTCQNTVQTFGLQYNQSVYFLSF